MARAGLVGLWLLLFAIVLAILVPSNVPYWWRIAAHGQRTSAKIVRLNCGDHNSATYVFKVGSERFEGSDVTTGCGSLRIGDVIPVYYDVNDPHLSRTTNPKAGLLNEVLFIGISCLIFPTLVIIYVKTKPSRGAAAPQ